MLHHWCKLGGRGRAYKYYGCWLIPGKAVELHICFWNLTNQLGARGAHPRLQSRREGRAVIWAPGWLVEVPPETKGTLKTWLQIATYRAVRPGTRKGDRDLGDPEPWAHCNPDLIVHGEHIIGVSSFPVRATWTRGSAPKTSR